MSKKNKETIDTKMLEKEGEKYFQSGNYSGAVSSWNRLLKIRGGENSPVNKNLMPKLAKAYHILASSASLPQDKLSFLLHGTSLDPNSNDLLLSLLRVCRETNNLQKYLDFCLSMINDKKNKDCFEKASKLILLEIGENNKKEAQGKSPFSSDEKKIFEALTFLKNNLPVKGIRILEQMPENEHNLFLKGMFYFQGKWFEQARPIFEKIVGIFLIF